MVGCPVCWMTHRSAYVMTLHVAPVSSWQLQSSTVLLPLSFVTVIGTKYCPSLLCVTVPMHSTTKIELSESSDFSSICATCCLSSLLYCLQTYLKWFSLPHWWHCFPNAGQLFLSCIRSQYAHGLLVFVLAHCRIITLLWFQSDVDVVDCCVLTALTDCPSVTSSLMSFNCCRVASLTLSISTALSSVHSFSWNNRARASWSWHPKTIRSRIISSCKVEKAHDSAKHFKCIRNWSTVSVGCCSVYESSITQTKYFVQVRSALLIWSIWCLSFSILLLWVPTCSISV